MRDPRRVQGAPEEPFLSEDLMVLEQASHAACELVQREGLFEVVASAPAKGGDGRLEGRVPGHHDDRRARVEHARSLQQVEAVETRHDEVRQDDVELLRLDAGQGLFSTAGRGHAVALGLKRRVQRVLHRGLVVHDKNRCGHRSPRGGRARSRRGR